MRMRTRLAMTDERPETSQTCDRCGPAVRAVFRAARHGELYLCQHCADYHWPALSAQGWTIRLVDEAPRAVTTRKPRT